MSNMRSASSNTSISISLKRIAEVTGVTEKSLGTYLTDLTNANDLEDTNEVKLDYFQIPGLLIKSFFLVITAILTIPFTGVLLAAYNVPTAICAMVEVFNLLMVAIALSQFASNRRVTQ